MKYKSPIICLVILVFSAGCSKRADKAQTLDLGALQLSSRRVKPGADIRITYLPNRSNLKGAQDIQGVLYQLTGRDIHAQTVAMKERQSDTLEARIHIPDSAQALVFNFKSKYKTDNNGDKGYAIPLYGKDGAVLPGAKAAMGYFYLRGRSQVDVNIRHDVSDALALIWSDMKNHPKLRSAQRGAYLIQYYRNNPEKGKGLVESQIGQLESQGDLDEDELSTLQHFYAVLSDKAKSDSVNRVLVSKFPHGKAASIQALQKIMGTKDLTKATALYEQYKTGFGSDMNADGHDYVVSNLARRYCRRGNLDAAMQLALELNSKRDAGKLCNRIAFPLAEKGEKLKQAQKISKKSLELLEEVKADPKAKPTYLTAAEWKARMADEYAAYADTYAFILFKRGKIKEAIAYQSKIAGIEADPEINEHYVRFLLADRQYDQALAHAREYMESNVGTPEIEIYLKQAYQKVHHSLRGYKAFLTKVKKTEKKHVVAVLKREMIDKPAPDFSLKDLKGNEVSLRSLRGKVVILDFWATWCGVCRASFPAMQKAVDQYKNDDGVKFLFVDTWENGDNAEARKKRVLDFIAAHPYRFHILMDKEKPLKSRRFQAIDAYGVRGIPTTFIIDPAGQIKFETGYKGSESALLQEIEAMVALARGKA